MLKITRMLVALIIFWCALAGAAQAQARAGVYCIVGDPEDGRLSVGTLSIETNGHYVYCHGDAQFEGAVLARQQDNLLLFGEDCKPGVQESPLSGYIDTKTKQAFFRIHLEEQSTFLHTMGSGCCPLPAAQARAHKRWHLSALWKYPVAAVLRIFFDSRAEPQWLAEHQ